MPALQRRERLQETEAGMTAPAQSTNRRRIATGRVGRASPTETRKKRRAEPALPLADKTPVASRQWHPPMGCSVGPRQRRCGFTLVEIMVVVAIIGAVLVMVLPGMGAMWEQRRAAEATTIVEGALATTRARALQGDIRGLLFVVVDAQQRIFPIESEPLDVLDEQKQVNQGADQAWAADRFKLSDGKIWSLPKPYRVAPLAALDANVWSAVELNSTSYRVPPVEPMGLQRHRNAFVVLFSPQGRLMSWRAVLIHDPDEGPMVNGDGLGDRTLLPVGEVSRWQAVAGQPADVLKTPMPDIIDDNAGAGVGFVGVDGLLVYDDATFVEIGEVPPQARRDYLKRLAQPLYIARYTGRTVSGPVNESAP